MPRRRLIAAPLLAAPLLAAPLLAATVLATGCEVAVSPPAVPVPFSVEPVPSASAGQPDYICTAAYKILTDGAVRLAGFAAGSGDSARDGMRQAFVDMAAQFDAQAARAGDTALTQALRAVSADLTAGARSADPTAYLNGGFATVGQKLDGSCD